MREPSRKRPPARFPRLRWGALLFLAVWFPTYWVFWGWRNFLQLCDVAVFLTVLGLWRGNALVLSSQLAGTLIVNLLWALDVAARLFADRHLIGGTEYMWNSTYPLSVRLLSLFHLVLSPLLFYAVCRTGYDRRAFAFESAIAVVILILSRLAALPGTNPNFVVVSPFSGHPIGSAILHLAIVVAVQILVLTLPVHLILKRTLPAARS
jgi:hypothetical protein